MSCIIVTLCCVLGLGQGPGDNSASSLIKSSLTELTPHSNNQYTSRSMAASQCLSVSPRLTEYLLTYLTAWIFEFDVLEAKLQRKELKVYSRHAETIYTVWTFKFFLQDIENFKLSIALHTYFELIRNSIGFHSSKLNKQQSFPGSHLPTSFLWDMHMLQNVRWVLLVWLIGEDIQKAHPKSINTSCLVNFLALLRNKSTILN